MKKVVLMLSLILFLANISAICEEGQIDINTASLEELDQLYGIGPVKAQAIIDTRPLISVDDLIRVNGIGNATLNEIKAQGLACVEDEERSDENNETNDNTGEITENSSNANDNPLIESEIILKPGIIKLNYPSNDTKDIKTEENSEFSDKNKNRIALYGFFVFSIIIGVLLIIRRKKIYKNDI